MPFLFPLKKQVAYREVSSVSRLSSIVLFFLCFCGGFSLSLPAFAQENQAIGRPNTGPTLGEVASPPTTADAGAGTPSSQTPSDGEKTTPPSGAVSAIEGADPLPSSVADPSATMSPVEKALHQQIEMLSPKIDVSKMKTLFFSIWEHDTILGMRRGTITRPLGDDDSVIGPQSTRAISLGGILYHSTKKWTVWINKNRVTPDAIPKEIMNLKVYKNYVEIEWFDADTNQIFPIRLRPHQRFDLDSKIFLPGE